jgi:flagellin
VGKVLSFTQTQSAYLTRISEALQRMTQLAQAAQDDSLAGPDRKRAQDEFSQLTAAISSSSTKQFNGVSLFSGTDLEVALDPEGNTVQLAGVGLNPGAYAGAFQTAGLHSTAAAREAEAKLQLAAQQLSQDRAGIEGNQTLLSAAANRLAVSRENLNAATANIQDADGAGRSTQFAGENFVAQPRAAMLAQANATPQRALRLLP